MVALESFVHTTHVICQCSLTRIRLVASNLYAHIRPFVHVAVAVSSFEVFGEKFGAGKVECAHATLEIGEMSVIIRHAARPIVRTPAML
jgi:hypothetical protein